MSLSSQFLNLSMKQQICISIIFLTIFSILVILAICCTLLYEILYKDYEQKKLYFYNKYKKYAESAFYFQSFHIMQYEEILHRIQKQIWKNQEANIIYQNLMPLQNYSEYIIPIDQNKDYNITELEIKESIAPIFYFISFDEDDATQKYLLEFANIKYQVFSNSIYSNNIYDSFKIPGYGEPIMDKPIFYSINASGMFGYNYTKIKDTMNKYNNKTLLDNYLYYIKDTYVSRMISGLEYIGNRLKSFEMMFPKFYDELLSHSENKERDMIYNETRRIEFANIYVGYMSLIKFGENKFNVLSSDETHNFYFTEVNTIQNSMFFLNKNFSDEFDIDFIPFNYSDNYSDIYDTLISKESCALFKIKQLFLSGKKFDFNDAYTDIHEKKDKLGKCFIDNDLIKSNEELNDVFKMHMDNFTEYTNLIYQGIFKPIPSHPEFLFYFMKYSYPNFNTLREFQSEYLFSNQVNFYAFIPFNKVQKMVDHVHQVNLNIFMFTILIIIDCWILCLIVNLIIFCRVIDDWTMPITKLQEAVETNSIKDESIFIYKYDDIINELFITCKELLSGQINHNNNDNGINNFNILGNDNEKKIDKNIYKKNLIINNEIMEELIEKQQRTMDFSNNVKLNDLNSIDSKMFSPKNKNNKTDTNGSEKNIDVNIDNNKKIENEKEQKINKKSQKNIENDIYIQLFKISEYLDYYRSKLDTNNIVYLNENGDDLKTNHLATRTNTKSMTSSITNTKKKNDETNDNHNYVNMMDEKNISYLWYMEAKKKNRCFNYIINNDCEELFSDVYDSYKLKSLNENRK